MFENSWRGRQACARNFTKNVPKILDLKPSSEQIFSEEFQDWLGTPTRGTHREYSSKPLNHNIVERILAFKQ